ncbi:unnamed protein product [Caenorhabditis sp. 36 PRJEB53466]|nr:unnamed protein product [Caenorhabditis sp. 36 PRJEB53466]
MEPLEALQKHIKKPDEYPLRTVTVDGVDYLAFGDFAYKKDTLTSLPIYGKSEFYSLESLVVFLKYKLDNHGHYVKEAAAANVRAVTRIDRKNVIESLQGDRPELVSTIPSEPPISLKKLLGNEEPEAKKPRLDNEAEKPTEPTLQAKKEVEVRALNDSLTVDRIAEMRRKRQSHREKGIVTIDESLSTLTSSSLPKTRIHRTRENVMLGVRDLSNVLDVISSAQRQWDLDEKKEKVAAVHASSLSRDQTQQQRSGYSRYAQEAFAHEKTKEIQTEGSFIGSNLSTLKQGHNAATTQKTPETPTPMRPPVSKPTPSPLTVQGGKRASRSPIIIVPAAMNAMINLYNARDILQNLGFVPVEKRRQEMNKKPTDLAIQRQKNGTTFNIRVVDNAEKLANEDWDRVIAVFVMGVAWQFKGWKWNGNPTDIFTHIPAFYFHFDNNKPVAQVMQWNVHKIPVSAAKRHMDKARFSQMWETIENFVRKNKPQLTGRLGAKAFDIIKYLDSLTAEDVLLRRSTPLIPMARVTLERGGWYGTATNGIDADWPYDAHVPGPSNYPDHSAPGPAPYSRTSVMNSTGRNPMSFVTVPANTSISSASRRPLQRQHRSMDGLGVLDAYKDSFEYDVVQPTGKAYHQPSYLPLEISTSQHHPHHHHGPTQPQFNRGASLALSNPIPTQNAFWQHNNSMATTSAGNQEYDMMQPGISRMAPTTAGGMNIAREYEQLKVEYETIMEKLNQTMNSIKTFWSPELKRERQLRRDEATRIAQLERMVHSGGGGLNEYGVGSNEALQLRMELREREERIRQLTTALESGSGGMDSRVRELEDTIMRLQDLLTTKETQAMMSSQDPSGRQAIENALRRIDEKQARIVELEEELMRQRMGRSNQPRDFTDKNLSGHEMATMRMKMERSEVELAERKHELMNCQTRMQTAEETANEMRSHLQLLKDQLTNREQHNTLLQGDVDALRQKLDSKNKQLEQKEERIGALERDFSSSKADVSDKTELIRQTEMKTSQLIGRIDGLENTVRDKEQELDRAKIRLLSHPDVVKEKEMTEKIEQGERERQRLQEHIDQLRRNSEKEQMEQQKTYQNEMTQLKATIDNLQKELSDRDILLESQNEKIGDMNRDLVAAKKRIEDAMVDKGTDELRKDVEAARSEVDKLLKMVNGLEKENSSLKAQCKQLSSEKRDFDKGDPRGMGGSVSGMSTITKSASGQSNLHKRIEELEEALRESVSITAEREVHLSQQKHHLQQMSSQLNEARKEISDLRRNKQNLSETGDRDQMIRAIEAERRQHLEQLFRLKQEALLAAISEKDTHLALLEKSRGPRDEIETIRRHKDALMRKLKQENERRVLVAHPDPVISMNAMASVIPGAPLPAPIIPGTIGMPLPNVSQPPVDQDEEGIWT